MPRHGTIYAPDSQAWRVDTQHDLGRGCVGYWSANTTGGSGLYLPDLSGQGNHGLLMNGPTWVAGQNGGKWALNFDGNNDQVYVSEAADPLLNAVDGLTIACHFNSPLEGDWRTFFCKGISFNSSYTLFRSAVNGTRLQIGGAAHYATNDIKGNVWETIAATWKPNFVGFYLDGLPNGTPACTVTTVATSPKAYIGRANTTYPFLGQIEWLGLWTRCLSAEAVARVTREPSAMLWQPGRRRYFDMAAVVGIITPRRFNPGLWTPGTNPGVM